MSDRVALLIEDDRLTAAVVSDWLSEAGWRVVHVERGGDALPRFAEVHPSLVLCDLVLPGVDGTTLCSNLRLQPFGDRVTILLTSARTEAAEAAMAAGADSFLPKPIRKEELLAALARPRAPSPAARVSNSAVRVPTAPVLGGGSAPETESGTLRPGTLVPLLRRLHDVRFNGVLEAEGPTADGPLRAKIFFHRGCPAAARSNDTSTEFGRVLEQLGILSPTHLADSVEEGRRTGLPLGEVLLRSRMVDRQGVERALREQVLLRTVGVGRLREGTYVLSFAEAMGLAGFDVHPAAVEWRLNPRAAPPLADQDLLDHHVRVDLTAGAWSLFDPSGDLGVLRALLAGGATARDCQRVGGHQAGALLGLLRSWGLALLTDALDGAPRNDAHVDASAEDLAARINAQHRALSDANLYIVLGVRPDTDTEGISIATVSALAAALPDSLPAGLDADTLRRARAVYERVLEAGRILGDPARRAIYDARLAGDAQLRSGEIDREAHAVLQAERARELFRKGEFVTAAALFGHAIDLEGDAADILAMLGWARHRACPDDPSAGEAELRQALSLDAEDEFALYYLGRLLGARGERDEARRLLRAAVAQNHEFEQARDALREIDSGSVES